MRGLLTKSVIAVLIPSLLFAPSCSLFQGDKQQVSVITDRPAKITVDGVSMGETKGGNEPLRLEPLTRKDEHLVIAQGDGLEARKKFTTTLSPLGILDVVGIFFFLIPGITLITGHAFMLEPETLRLELTNPATPSETKESPDIIEK